jgi:NADPH:quinone reductase-like Zn-dependent oxidoreductase
MRVFEVSETFGLERLRLAERPLPEPGPGQVRLRMRAVSLNYRDVMMVDGRYNPKQPLPLIPCSDGVGVVDAVGSGVRGLAIGDRVATLFAQTWQSGPPTREKARATLGGPLDGTLAEHMVLAADGVVPLPEYLSDAEGATLPCAALTAWSALAVLSTVKPGEVVLVQGTGGVSLFALQFARAMGARVIATSSHDHKRERLRELGAWATLDYRADPTWGRSAKQLTGGIGVDHVVDVGGSTLEQSLWAVRIGGNILSIGVLGAGEVNIRLASLFMQNVRLQGVLVGSRESFEGMLRAMEAHQIHPLVDRVFSFEETSDAFRHLQEGRHFGKVVIAFET